MGRNEPHKGSGLLRIYDVRHEELRNLPSALLRIPGEQRKTDQVERDEPGDLVFYGSSRGRINHVAMYIGNGQIIHAASRRSGIKISTWNYRTPMCIVDVIGNRS